jgi:hypothetical protein
VATPPRAAMQALGRLPAEGFRKGDGRSFNVIFRTVPGFSKRKSVNGGCGSGSAASAAGLGVDSPDALAGAAFEPESVRK